MRRSGIAGAGKPGPAGRPPDETGRCAGTAPAGSGVMGYGSTSSALRAGACGTDPFGGRDFRLHRAGGQPGGDRPVHGRAGESA